jgi:hypothetical protein
MHVNVNWRLERQVMRKRETGCWIKKKIQLPLCTPKTTLVIVSDGLYKETRFSLSLSLQNPLLFFLASQTLATICSGADVSISPRFYARNIPYFIYFIILFH